MTDSARSAQPSKPLEQLEAAAASGQLSAGAVDNIRSWLTEPRYRAYAPLVAEHLAEGKWQALDDAFWTVIPFGTGGRRGRMYPIGSNAINERTIGESAQGLANYVNEALGDQGGKSCAIAYDTRHRSREFAELCAEIMVAAGFKVFFLDDYRSTPELSFLVRYKHCSCGIMVTASHNPPSDNAVKVYWSTGGQILPPHDQAIIDRVMNVDEIVRANFDEALGEGSIVVCNDEVDAAFIQTLVQQATPGPRDIKIIYSPLHGVGASAAMPVLEQAGFEQLELFGPHAEPSGDFPNVPGHVSNPENPAVFDAIIERAQQTGAELILASDPDCDRLGCAAPLTLDPQGPWATLNGNQIGALLADYVLHTHKQQGTLHSRSYVVKTLVTTEMIRRIADSYGVRTLGDLLVGFKWIGGVMDQEGPEDFVFGTEESHGYLVGTYARDKDGAVACLLMSELAALAKSENQSLHQKLESLYWQHGYHQERLLTVTMEGSEGMSQMKALMESFRTQPPQKLGGIDVAAVRDYQNQVRLNPADGSTVPLEGPCGDLVILDLALEGSYVAVRPSGTEPKIKYYMFTYQPAELLASLEDARADADARLSQFAAELSAFK